MNHYELFLSFFNQKKPRNVFIHKLRIEKSKRFKKMNKKRFIISLLAILAISALTLTATAYAMPFMNWNSTPSISNRMTMVQQSCVRMDGVITTWGSNNVLGGIQAQSRTLVINSTKTVQGFSASAIWTTNSSRPIASIRLRENFTYSFYTARLVNGSFSALDYNGDSFFLNGTWNVWNLTETFTITTDSSGAILSVNSNQKAVPLATNATGNLAVSLNWSSFTLSVTGVDPLSGKVVAELTSSKMFNPFMTDIGSSTTVTKADLSKIVDAYGSAPGWGNYDVRYDYCAHNTIDIFDLTTAAANLNVGQ